MKIHVTTNHKYIDEIQTIAQVFFPHARFCYGEAAEPTEWAIVSFIADETITGEAYANGKLHGQYNLNVYNQPKYLTKKRMVMLAMYHALFNAVDIKTPWGALTGVRPTKMVREWMDNGLSDAQVMRALQSTFCVQEDRAMLAVKVAHEENRLAQRILSGHPTKNISGLFKPIGIYVSIPFCPSRCVYCSFNTAHKPWNYEMQARYIQAIITECQELPLKLHKIGGQVSSIYIGGGTPTALTDDLLEQLLIAVTNVLSESAKEVKGEINCKSDSAPIEFTIEAGRPDTITSSNLRLMRHYGVNRISINPQTINDKTLEIIGRRHTAQDFLRAFEMTREEDFTCINTDVIAGLPGEGLSDMHNTMETLAILKPENITVHTLAIKRASKLNEHRVEQTLSCKTQKGHNYALPSTSTIEAQLKIAYESCAAQGLLPYYLYRQKNMAALFENTGYSLPGHECLYNIGMMSEIQTVLGVGAGAVSKYIIGNTLESDGSSHMQHVITRDFNPKNPDIYIERRSKL